MYGIRLVAPNVFAFPFLGSVSCGLLTQQLINVPPLGNLALPYALYHERCTTGNR
jgi:hypothetical protein